MNYIVSCIDEAVCQCNLNRKSAKVEACREGDSLKVKHSYSFSINDSTYYLTISYTTDSSFYSASSVARDVVISTCSDSVYFSITDDFEKFIYLVKGVVSTLNRYTPAKPTEQHELTEQACA